MSMLSELMRPGNGNGSGGGGRFVVTLTPTSPDFSGVMDKTVAEINEAWEEGKDIWFRVSQGADTAFIRAHPNDYGGGYLQFAAELVHTTMNVLIVAWTKSSGDGSQNEYSTTIFALTPYTPT